MKPAENIFKNQILIHECHEKPIKNAKSQFEQAKIPPENPKTQFENAKTQKTAQVLAQVFLDRRSKKSPAMPNAVLQNTRAPKYPVPQWLCPNSWCSKC